MSRLKGKVAIITGALGGQGQVAVRRFVEEGARVLVSDLRGEAAEAVVTDQELLYPLHQLVKASRVPSMKVVCPNALKDLKDVVVSVVDVVNVVPDMRASLVKRITH
jgi:NAD(P)-dependent dehydrogenase (short-subunit alcohol dehydrogenase family)